LLSFALLVAFNGGEACAAQISQLWGTAGERWTPESRLPDFSLAGYRRSQEPYRLPREQVSITAFGAKGDGKSDDSAAFKEALDKAAGKIIFMPAGRYLLSDSFDIQKSNTVLRGAGSGKIILVFSKPLEELHPFPARTGAESNTTQWSWSGGLIMIGSMRGLTLKSSAGVTAPANRGATKLTVGKNEFHVGDELLLTLTDDTEQSLLKYLYRMQSGNVSGLKNWKCRQIFRITAISDQELTLDRPSRFEIRPAWSPTLSGFIPEVTDVGLEGLTFEFPAQPYAGHFKELGFNPVQIGSSAMHCWLHDILIRNADSGPFINGWFCTADGIRLEADPHRRSADGMTGHHGITFEGNDCLCTNFDVDTPFIHDLSVQSAVGCVFSKGKGRNLNFDHHRWAPYENLYTEIDAGDGTRLFESSGFPIQGAHTAAGATFWNIHTRRMVNWPQDFGPPEINFVAVRINAPSERSLNGRWFEPYTPGDIQPPNIYVAMAQRQHPLEKPATIAATPAAPEQHWKTWDGREFSAVYVRVENNTVVLQVNQVNYSVPLTQLSPESQAIIKKLAFNENGARAANPMALPAPGEAEKSKIAGPSQGAVPIGADGGGNFILNGDFTKAKANGMAENWTLNRKGVSGVTNEHGYSYFHFVDTDGMKQFFSQTVDRPLEANEVVVKFRMRAPELKGPSAYGIAIWQLDAQDQKITYERPVEISGPVPEWRTYTATVKLRPKTKKIQLRGFMDNGLTGAVDYGDFRGEMH